MVGERSCAIGAEGYGPGNTGTRAVASHTAIAGIANANAIANGDNAVRLNTNSGSVNHECYDTMCGTGTAGSAKIRFSDTRLVANPYCGDGTRERRVRRPAGANLGGRWTRGRH
jgi:hypothetical protein